MKGKRLLILGAAFALGISACAQATTLVRKNPFRAPGDVTVSLDFTSNFFGISATQGKQTLTGTAATYGFEFDGGSGAKASGANPSSTSYVLFGKTGAYFRSTSAPENSYISAISWTYASGVSTNVILSISYGESALTEQASSAVNQPKATANGTVSLTSTDTSNKCFFVYVTNNYNCQLKNFSVTYSLIDGSSSSSDSSESSSSSSSSEQPLLTSYTLDGTIAGTGSGYADNNNITQNGVDWIVNGNTTMNPWRIGGKSLTNTNRKVYSKTAMPVDADKIDITFGTADSVTVNSLKIGVYSSASGAASGGDTDIIESFTPTFAAANTISVYKQGNTSWLNCYYNITLNVTISATSNKFVQLVSVVISNTGGSQPIEPTSLTLTGPANNIEFSDKVQIAHSFGPEGASGIVESWASSNLAVATISDTGLVTAVGAGTTTITATSGELVGTCTVTVNNPEPITVANAITAANALSDNGVSTKAYIMEEVYILSIKDAWDDDYHNISFYVGDESDSDPELEVFRTSVKDNKGPSLKPGDIVTVVGKLEKYVKNNSTTLEFVNGMTTLVTAYEEVEEPAVLNATVAEFKAAEYSTGVAYNVTATVKYWKNQSSAKDQYGNMVLTDGTNELTIYGSTATASALSWDKHSSYIFTNPKDFLTEQATADLKLGDQVTMKMIRSDYNGSVQGSGVITNIVPSITIELDHSSLEVKLNSTGQLSATISSESYSATWMSDNGAIATVNNSGLITPVKAGETVITAFVDLDADGVLDANEPSAQCSVKVVNPASSLASSLFEADLTGVASVTSGFTITTANNEHKTDGYYQDKGTADSAVSSFVVKGQSALFAFEPVSIEFSAILGAGSNREELNHNVEVCYVDSDGEEIVSSKVVLTTGLTKSPAEYSITLPFNADAYGVKLMHTKEDGWNARYYSFKLSYKVTSAVKALAATEIDGEVSGVSITLGASISQLAWESINSSTPITAYGVMTARRTSASSKTVIEAYKDGFAVADKRIEVSETPTFTNGNLTFTAKINVSNYNTLFGVAPYIVAGGEIYFLEELDYSVKELAQEYLAAEDYSVLSQDVLNVLAGN